MSGFKVDFHDLEHRLMSMEKSIEKEFTQKVLEPAGKEIAEGIKSNIVGDDLVLTGKLRDSIDVHSFSGRGTKAKAKVGIKKGTDQEIFRYGMTHNYGSKRGTYPAHHFIEKGFSNKRAKAQEIIKEKIKEELGL